MVVPTGSFWAEVFEPAACRSMAEKYERVFEAIDMAPGRRQATALRAVARQWPGCLREAQTVEPAQLRSRGVQAREGARADPRSRNWWRHRGWACLPLWHELHGLVADQLAWRRVHPLRADALEAFLQALDPDGRERWPTDARTLALRGGPRLVPIQAQRWLAGRIGWSVAELHQCLFTRVGRSSRAPDHDTEPHPSSSRT